MSLTPQQCEEFWCLADKDGDGELSIQELAAAVKIYNPKLNDKECSSMFLGIDKDGDKRISKKEFMSEMAEKPKRSQALIALFQKYDKDKNGSLSQDEVRRLVGDFFRPDQVEDILEKFMHYSDSSGDGLVSFNEFKSFFA